jgi:hypothetical protein
MKHIYALLCLTALLFLHPKTAAAQCTCAGGVPADSSVQVQILTGILPFSSVVPFNKFSPSLGTLSCVVTRTTVYTEVSIEIVNRDTTSRVNYQYNYTRTTSLTGPSISVSASNTKIYGPFELGQAGVDPDTVATFGPDVYFNNIVMNRQTSSSLGTYTGTGTVNFTYNNSAISGFVIGNSNNQTTIADFSNVSIKLVYYFCPLVILKNQMRDFLVSRENDALAISWTMDNDEFDHSYEIERSTDGINFQTLTTLEGRGKGTQKYHYDHPLQSTPQGKLYFRVKMINKDGQSIYSAVKMVAYGENAGIEPSVFPNPVVNEVNIRMGAPQTGTLSAEILSMNGQVLQSRQYKANRLTNLQFNLNRKYPSGAYFLRVKNAETGTQAVTRVFIQ